MFGDILSDLTAELSGSLGLGGSLNSGVNHAMGQAAHGSAPDIAGQNIANPFSLFLSASMLLGWYGQRKNKANFLEASRAMNEAVAQAIFSQEATSDVGGKLGTAETGAAFVKRISA
jgi:3-isopropylmalate dehydrogenase